MIERLRNRLFVTIAVVAVLWGTTAWRMPWSITPAGAQTPALSDTQDVNGAQGVIAEIIRCKREDGVLTVQMRLRNTSDKEVRVYLVNKNAYDEFYVVAASKKYFVLRDSEKTPLAPPSDGGTVGTLLPKGGTYVWYAKYPAPPPAVKKVSYYTPITPPFEGIPISD